MEGCISVRKRVIVLKDYMERIVNEENDLGYNVEGDTAEGPED